jgi:hypothetical protein
MDGAPAAAPETIKKAEQRITRSAGFKPPQFNWLTEAFPK